MSSKDNYNDDDFEKMFSEIVNSEDLQNMSQTYKSDIAIGLKEMLLIHQSLVESLSHINEIILSSLDGENLLKNPEGEPAELISSLYKISEDFNDCMQDQFVEFAIIDEDENDIEDLFDYDDNIDEEDE